MDSSSSKRIRAAGGRSSEGKVHALPLLCVEAICKFTPTSKLIHLYSAAVPLPGLWNLGLEAVLKKRRPFSLSHEFEYHPASDPTIITALFDSGGSKLATVKHPEAFQFSPLCEFVESATVLFAVIPAFAAAEASLRFVSTAAPLLSHLPNITKCVLIDRGNFKELSGPTTLGDHQPLFPGLKEVLPQLESFAIEQRHNQKKTLDILRYVVEMLPDMAVLKHLGVPYLRFDTLMRAAAGSERSEAVRHVLSGLRSVQLRQLFPDRSPGMALQCVDFVSGCCTHLTHLSMVAEGEFKPFLIALRALANLSTLGLELVSVKTTGITFSEDGIRSISELRLNDKICFRHSAEADATAIAIASLFPSVRTASFDCGAFAAKLCQAQVLPELAQISCSSTVNCYEYLCGTSHSKAQFLANSYLPSVVDLSPVTHERLSYDANMLTDIYRAMQKGSVRTLLLRGPLHREALPHLQTRVDLCVESANVTAWKDRDLGAQTCTRYGRAVVPALELPEQTDVRIVGMKDKGDQFTIRVVHQHTRKGDVAVAEL